MTPTPNPVRNTMNNPDPFWMVQGPGPSTVRHTSLKQACEEAERLARQQPGDVFVVMRAVTSFSVETRHVVEQFAEGVGEGEEVDEAVDNLTAYFQAPIEIHKYLRSQPSISVTCLYLSEKLSIPMAVTFEALALLVKWRFVKRRFSSHKIGGPALWTYQFEKEVSRG